MLSGGGGVPNLSTISKDMDIELDNSPKSWLSMYNAYQDYALNSRLGIPLSTTHCQVGATVGVGALENPKTCGGINCKVFAKTMLGWIITCLIVGLTSAIFTAQGVFGPSKFNYCPTIQNITN